MRRAAAVWMTCLAIISTGGCVTEGEHQVVVTELETTRKDLANIRAQQQELEQQRDILGKLNAQTMRDLQAASATVQEARNSYEAERKSNDEQLDRLVRKLNQLVGQQKSLRRGLQEAKEDTVTLKSLADMYQKKLLEPPETMAAAPPSTVMLPPEAASPTPVPPAQLEPSPAPPVGQPGQQARTSPLAQQPPPPQAPPYVDDSWLGAIKRWVISLWDQVFS